MIREENKIKISMFDRSILSWVSWPMKEESFISHRRKRGNIYFLITRGDRYFIFLMSQTFVTEQELLIVNQKLGAYILLSY